MNSLNQTSARLANVCNVQLKYEIFPLDYGYYVCGPILAALIAVGFLGNAVCLSILFRTHPTPVVSFYTIPLCVCDCAVLSGSFLMTNLPNLLYGRMQTYGPYVRLYPFLNFFSNFAYTSCVWLVVFLSVERYFALCHPLKHKIYDARRRSFAISILCLIAAAIYNVPRYFEIRTYQCFELTKRTMIDLMQPTEFRGLKSYWIAYKVVMGPTLFSMGPFLFLCFLSVRMWREVKRTRLFVFRRRKAKGDGTQNNNDAKNCDESLTAEKRYVRGGSHDDGSPKSGDKQRRVLSYTLLCVLLKFLICHTLPAVIDLCETLMNAEQFHQPVMEHLVDTSTLLVVANSSLNIFIYAWCSGGFRKRMKTLLAPRSSLSLSGSMGRCLAPNSTQNGLALV